MARSYWVMRTGRHPKTGQPVRTLCDTFELPGLAYDAADRLNARWEDASPGTIPANHFEVEVHEFPDDDLPDSNGMTEPQDSIRIRLQDHDDETMEILVNGRFVASLNHDEHGSEAMREVIRVLELTAGELGVGFSDET